MSVDSDKKKPTKKASSSSSKSKGASVRKKKSKSTSKKKSKKRATRKIEKNSERTVKNSENRGTKVPNKYAPKTTLKSLVSHVIETENKLTRGSAYKKSMNDIALTLCQKGETLRSLGKLLGVSKFTVIEWRKLNPTFNSSIIEGYALWLREMPDKLIKHLSTGKSYTTFGAQINRSKDFLYSLEKAWPEFKEAKGVGLVKSQDAWENAAMKQVYGQMTVNLGQVPLMGNGHAIKDEDGKIIMVDRIIPAKFSDRALVFSMQNRFDDYKPSVDNTDNEILDELKDAIAEVNGDTSGKDGQKLGEDPESIG